MTYVVGDGTGSGLHLLVICVASYEDPALNRGSYLGGVVASAERLIECWRTAPLPDGMALASIDVLVSRSDKMKPILGAERAEAAKFANVKDAFERLVTRRNSDDLGIIHWIGHGASYGLENGWLRGVFVEDMVHTEEGSHPSGFDIKSVIRSLEVMTKMPLLVTIDACATECTLAGLRKPFINPLRQQARGEATKVRALYSSPAEHEAYCVAPDRTLDDGIKGGALFSEAIRLALSGFGAEQRWQDKPAVYADSLAEAAQHHHGRLCRRIAKPGHGIETVGAKFDNERPLVEPLNPKGAVLFKPRPAVALSELACRVKRQSREDDARLEESHWEAHLEHDNAGHAYEAYLTRGSPPIAGATGAFTVKGPITRQWLAIP